MLHFTRHAADRTDRIAVAMDNLVIAGWTGRDAAAIQHHIEELAAIGVPRPSRVPLFYRVAVTQLTQTTALQVLGPDTSGEVEPVIVSLADGLWLGIGSDHTDRKAESISVALSKQLCGKVIGTELWRFDEIARDWDKLVLRSHAEIDGKRALYQEGPLAGIRSPEDLIARYAGAGQTLSAGTAMFCGTLGANGGVRPGTRFEMEIEDKARGRSLRHAYTIDSLKVIA